MKRRQCGSIQMGNADARVARLMIVACAGTTHEHFASTLKRLLPTFRSVDPMLDVEVWTTLSKFNSVKSAFRKPPSTAVVWILPLANLYEKLREHPDIVVPVLILDEFTHPTPREKCISGTSKVLCTRFLQATPQAFARCGGRTMLNTMFHGNLTPPRNIKHLIRARRFMDATLAIQQATVLDVVTVTPFRHFLYNDMSRFIPVGMEVTFVPSRRVTLSSALLGSRADLVPASLERVILSILAQVCPTDDSVQRVKTLFEESSQFTLEQLCTMLQSVQSKSPYANFTTVHRLIERVQEFQDSCPICFCSSMDVRIFACCGYCICGDCFSRCSNQCPFCRSAYLMVPREEENVDRLPRFDPARMVSHSQTQNLKVCIRELIEQRGYNHLCIVQTMVGMQVQWTNLGMNLDVDMIVVDPLIQGKGSKFVPSSAVLIPDPKPMLLFTMSERFLVGTDLAFTDAIIVVGDVRDTVVTQAMGRIFRPLERRDNTPHSDDAHLFGTLKLVSIPWNGDASSTSAMQQKEHVHKQNVRFANVETVSTNWLYLTCPPECTGRMVAG